MKKDCFFCNWNSFRPEHKMLFESENFIVHLDDFPVSDGHVEISPKQHIESIFELPENLATELLEVTKQAKAELDKKFKPDGYSIGINEGAAAGRTVDHLHIHIIPRYLGDIENPRGGIRNIIPNKVNYPKL